MDNLVYLLYGATRLTDLKQEFHWLFNFGIVIFAITAIILVIAKFSMNKKDQEDLDLFTQAFKNCRERNKNKVSLRKWVFFSGAPKEDVKETESQTPSFNEIVDTLNKQRVAQGSEPLVMTNLSYTMFLLLDFIKFGRVIAICALVMGSVGLVIPSTRDAAIIASSYGVTKAVQNETVQRGFQKSVTIVEVWLDKLNVENAAPSAPADAASKAAPADQPASSSQGTVNKADQVVNTAITLKGQVEGLLGDLKK